MFGSNSAGGPISSINQSTASAHSSVFSAHRQTTSSISHIDAQSTPAVGSIFRVGNSRLSPSSSVFHPGTNSDTQSDAELDEIRDRIRYRYIQKKIREKQGQVNGKRSSSVTSVGVGLGFRTQNAHSRADSYKNVTSEDPAYFQHVIQSHRGAAKGDGGFSQHTKMSMKQQVWRDSRAGVLQSRAERKKIENLIDGLPGSGH